MNLIFFLICPLLIFFLIHIVLQNIFKKHLIKNFIIASIINLFLLNLVINSIHLALLEKIILNINLIFGQLVYLIIVQSFRSSIQIYILNNNKKIDLKLIKKEELNVLKYRINILKKNNIITQNKKKLFYKRKILLSITYYIFLFTKIIYKEKFE